ncbi:MAG: formyltetrahydrofolate deformylase, partial [Chloroflexota bacterium]|nr:formyltetrahydrofolate deformylase [Chloroflexota bacterium]
MADSPYQRADVQNTGRLLIACPDRPGIVAAVARFLYEHGANITDSSQHSTDPAGGTFFMRVEFNVSQLMHRGADLELAFAPLAETFCMEWRLALAGRTKRLAVFVSKAEHALFELLWRHRAGDLRADISMVISNHPDLEQTVTSWGVPFYHIPVERERKGEAEARQLALLDGAPEQRDLRAPGLGKGDATAGGAGGRRVDAVVLARYMQILSPVFVASYPHSIINIHHSFLPAFVGADPYARAHERGVKLIGATAHYVTAALDAGPIIEQDV